MFNDIFVSAFQPSQNFIAYSYATVTYVIPLIALLFVMQFLGRGKWNTVLFITVMQAGFTIFAIISDMLQSQAYTQSTMNNILVILGVIVILFNLFQPKYSGQKEYYVFQLGYLVLGIFVLVENIFGIISEINLKLDSIGFLLSIGSLETVGFLFFLGCLGYIATARFFENETKIAAVEREMETARRIQYSLLPAQIPDSDYFSLSALYKPMTAVAGDIYDFSLKAADIGILVADVSGHGIPAALIASMVKTAFKTESEYLKSPAVLMKNMNRVLAGQFDQEFVTAAYLYMEVETGTIRFANAGHPPVLHYRKARRDVTELNSKGMILGPFASAKYEEKSHKVSPGDTLLFYTDGITEAMNRQNEQFGEIRLKQFLAQHNDKSPEDFSDLLLNRLQSWIAEKSDEGFADDFTLVVLQVKPSISFSRSGN